MTGSDMKGCDSAQGNDKSASWQNSWENLIHVVPDPLNNPHETHAFVNPYTDEETRGADPDHLVTYIRNIGPTNFPPFVVMNLTFGNDFLYK